MEEIGFNFEVNNGISKNCNNKLKIKIENKVRYVKKGTNLYKIFKDNYEPQNIPVTLVKINGKYFEFTSPLEEDGDFEPVNITDNMGNRAYERTLQFVLIRAAYDIFKDKKLIIEHSLDKNIFGEIIKDTPLNEDEIIKIKNRMSEIIEKDIPINKIRVTKKKAIDIFIEYDMPDKVKLINNLSSPEVSLYELDGRYDYFYGPMAYSTGVLKLFNLIQYNSGFLLMLPNKNNPEALPKFLEYKKLTKIFNETKQWNNILGLSDVGSLNYKVQNNKIFYMIRIAEALHEKKIAYIADMISKRESTKVVLISGPTSSGKTTFSKRLAIQLGVNGHVPVPISLDDYFVDREHTPKDEDGNYDFESIYALDLKLFNKHLQMLMNGEEIELPSFNFKNGCREWNGKKRKLPENGIIIIEGIHGLNEVLTSSIPKENKFKIYISALTQLNLDNHNRIATTDVRIIRRIVRDYMSRGYSAEDTLRIWSSVKKGEEKNIFVFQENADVMFNSTLVYELCILKKYALKEINKISETSDVYFEALRLKSFLNFFKDVDEELVPDNSILREFIGGSCFYKY